MLHRLIKQLRQLTAKLNNFIKWGLSKSKLIGVVFAIARVESQIEQIKQEEKMSKFEQQKKISTLNGGFAIYQPSINRYEVGSRMWNNGGGSIVGYAYNQQQLDKLLQKADAESLHSKQQAEILGEVHAFVPSGYEVNDVGELELIEDLVGFNSDPY